MTLISNAFISIMAIIQMTVFYVQTVKGSRSIFKISSYAFLFDRLIPKKNYLHTDMTKVKDEECLICMNNLIQEVDRDMVKTGNRSTTYIMTQCDHFFHPHCIVRAMELKSQCPRCITYHPKINQADIDFFLKKLSMPTIVSPYYHTFDTALHQPNDFDYKINCQLGVEEVHQYEPQLRPNYLTSTQRLKEGQKTFMCDDK